MIRKVEPVSHAARVSDRPKGWKGLQSLSIPPYKVVAEYLDSLKQAGAVNMFAAHPYLMREFGLDHEKAREFLYQWINTLRASGPIGPIEFDDKPISPLDNMPQQGKK